MQLTNGSLLQGGKYKIEKILGQGGFGITYLARQVNLDRDVAIKEFFMKDYCDRDDSSSKVTVGSSGSRDIVAKYREKFVKEAKSIARLNHPNIVRVIDVFEENETAYYVMEYLSDNSLSRLVKKNGRLPEDEALKYIDQIASTLDYIHARKMLHLDVKPANILLDEKENAVLIDFGMVKHYDSEGNQTSTTPVGVSAGYAPFEQYSMSGKTNLSPATDIYALGATLYKLLTGITPPDASTLISDPEALSFPLYLSGQCIDVIRRSMDPVARRRPQTIYEFKELLVAPLDVEDKERTVFIEEEEATKVFPEQEKNEKKDPATADHELPPPDEGADVFVSSNKLLRKLLPSSKRAFIYALVFYSLECFLWTLDLIWCEDMNWQTYHFVPLYFGFSAGTCLLSVICLMNNLRIGLVIQLLMWIKFLIFIFFYTSLFGGLFDWTLPFIISLIPLLLTFSGIRMKNQSGVTKWQFMKTRHSVVWVKCLRIVTLCCFLFSCSTSIFDQHFLHSVSKFEFEDLLLYLK